MSCSLTIEIRPVTPPDVPAISLLAREIWHGEAIHVVRPKWVRV